MENKKKTALRKGVLIFLGLAVLTAIEYALGVMGGMVALLVVIALFKAALVVWFYMHIYRLFRPGEESHE